MNTTVILIEMAAFAALFTIIILCTYRGNGKNSAAKAAISIRITVIFMLLSSVQPSVTSRIIITTKPREKAIVPILECFPSDISGISSSTTTYIMAPAAKARK